MEVIFTRKARDDLYKFFQYTKRSELSSKTYIKELIEYSQTIAIFPYLGKIVDNINNISIRQLIHKKHKILYVISKNKIYILRCIHNSKNFKLKKILNLKKFPKN